MTRLRRSALYMPASNPRAIAKAWSLPCDVVILDLEDAVAPDMKEAARAGALAAVQEGGFGQREVVVRVNAIDTPWGADDLAALRTVRPDAVLLPKISSAQTMHDVRAVLGDNRPLWAMIETCRGIVDLGSIVTDGKAAGLALLVAGTNDLAKEMRCIVGAGRVPLLPALAQIVMAARMAGLDALDGVCNAIDDGEVLAAECRQGLAFGFDGKTLIHPSQVEIANDVFSPTPEAIAWARKIVAAFADPGNVAAGAIRLDGKMVEILHLEEAQRTLRFADALNREADTKREMISESAV
jgi:citrate lyase subunit beta / citryl-CoA lyase